MSQVYPDSATLHDALRIRKIPSHYTSTQVAQYLIAIGFETIYDADAISTGGFPVDPENLERLVLLHMLAFPFENTTMHYTPEHDMDVTHEGIFHRFVNQKHGSYCLGHNLLMLEMLRGLGYRAYMTGARVNHAPDVPYFYTSFTHLVILVQPFEEDTRTYLLDVGFGSSCLTRPILLSADPGNFVHGLNHTERHRLTYSSREDSSLEPSKSHSVVAGGQWNLEVGHMKSKNGSTRELWRRQYSFSEAEVWHEDVLFLSFGVCNRPVSTNIFWNNVLCLKLCTLDEGNLHLEKIRRPMYRFILYGKEVRKSFGGESEVVRRLETELDRIHALREIFGIMVRDEDQVHIAGRAPAYDKSST